MEIFRELYLRGESDRFAATMDLIEQCLPRGWSRHRAAEQELRSGSSKSGMTCYCFQSEGVDGIAAATIYLVEREIRKLVVGNIIPRDMNRLTYGQYNDILEEFCDRVARPCIEPLGFAIELTPGEIGLDHWLSKTALRKLRAFSSMANKGTGASHPLDQERWLDFVVTAHREGGGLPTSMLKRWLIEIEGWDPEVADRLAIEYGFGGEVLTFSGIHQE